MTHVPASITTIAAVLALALAPAVGDAIAVAGSTQGGVQATTVERLVPLRTVEVRETIDGVRTADSTPEQELMVADAVQRFADAGWPLTNTEVRFDEQACTGTAGFHAEDRGHHVVVMCANAMWTLLHELGHVWSDLYLEDTERRTWLSSRGLDSWSEGKWHERGTEHVAEVIAFGLYDTVHVPMSIRMTDYDDAVTAFDDLFDVAPRHVLSRASVDVSQSGELRQDGEESIDV